VYRELPLGRHILMYRPDGERNKRVNIDTEKVGKLLCPRKDLRADPESAPPRLARHWVWSGVHAVRTLRMVRPVSASAQFSPQPSRLQDVTGMLHMRSNRFDAAFRRTNEIL